MNKSIRPGTALSLTAAFLLGCSSYQATPTPFKRPEQIGNSADVLGATVAARAFDDPKEAQEAFGGFDIRKAGLLPVQVVFDNRGSRSLRVNPAQTFLEDEQENLWPILDKQLAYDRAAQYANTQAAFKEGAHKGFLGAAAGALVGAAVGTVTGDIGRTTAQGAAIGGAGGAVGGGAAAAASGEARKEAVRDLREKDLENNPVGPGQLVVGFIFFPGEVVDARELRLQMRDIETGEVDTVELAL